MEKKIFTFVFVLLFGIFTSVSYVNAQFGAVVDTEDSGEGEGSVQGSGYNCYSTYERCAIGCVNIIFCDDCSRRKVDSYSDPGKC